MWFNPSWAAPRALCLEEDVARHGMPGQDDMVNHRFVAATMKHRALFERWLRATIPAENIVFRYPMRGRT